MALATARIMDRASSASSTGSPDEAIAKSGVADPLTDACTAFVGEFERIPAAAVTPDYAPLHPGYGAIIAPGQYPPRSSFPHIPFTFQSNWLGLVRGTGVQPLHNLSMGFLPRSGCPDR